MLRILHATAAAVAMLSLAACTAPGGIDPAAPIAVAKVDQLQGRFDAVQPYAVMLLPYLSVERAARLRLVLAGIERALIAARLAATVADRRAALAVAEQAIARVEKRPAG